MSGLLGSQADVISARFGLRHFRCSLGPSDHARLWLLSVLGLTLVLQSACANGNVPRLAPSDQLNLAEQEYRIGPADVIEVMVWKNPDLSRQVTVRPDGQISLPLIDKLYVTGRTPSELNELITEQLRHFYKDPPEVSVIVHQANSYVIYVLGNVLSQGRFVVGHGVTFLQGLALAGGFQPFARPNDITVRRQMQGGEEVTFGVSYKEVLAKREKNLVLQPGDIIIVP